MPRWVAEFVVLVNHQTMRYKIPLMRQFEYEANEEMRKHGRELQQVSGFVIMEKRLVQVTEDEYTSPDHYNKQLRFEPFGYPSPEDEVFAVLESPHQEPPPKSKLRAFWDWLRRYFCCSSYTPEIAYKQIDPKELDPLVREFAEEYE